MNKICRDCGAESETDPCEDCIQHFHCWQDNLKYDYINESPNGDDDEEF